MTASRLLIFVALIALQITLSPPCFAQFSSQHYHSQYPGLIKHVDPEYPPEVYRRGVGGRGIFLLKVNAKGVVDEVKIVKSTGHQILNEMAAKAFFQWQFQPGVTRQVRVPYEFYVSGFSRILH
jgi:TonB family protein